ncbi:bromodomain adjacent to zinc finger domain protein 1A-like [Pistacia vera]|uniref:bromodomain adjacent to zinc finger domain protein 1A-like n=1 Tax=Pistacia vera TaxID=55513 RepID=UPI00126344A0|nr:bromodomain adjacent to zinc finger domain protein 1A-like [Pistacia vera]
MVTCSPSVSVYSNFFLPGWRPSKAISMMKRKLRRCEEKADGKDCLVCDSMYHVSCVEPAVKEIPPKSWYCVSCAAKGIGLPHENCLVCERLNDEILDACF